LVCYLVNGQMVFFDPLFTKDTSMALLLATSLIENGFVPTDQLERYLDWYQNGTMSSNGVCFDIGITCRMSLEKFQKATDVVTKQYPASTGELARAGNGSLMRLASIPLYYRKNGKLALIRGKLLSFTHFQLPTLLVPPMERSKLLMLVDLLLY
jgi:ADP-ribosyl-[dinitrogen reductase] hydrolase